MFPCDRGLICIEAGSEKCPCFLALMKRCPICTYVNREPLCDCKWTGVCILLEAKWSHQNESHRLPMFRGQILSVRHLGAKALYIQVRLPKGITYETCNPGMFFWIMAPGLSQVPSFICDVGRDFIGLITICFSKGMALRGKEVGLQGPCNSHLIGENVLYDLSGGRALLVGEGFFQGAMVLAAKMLINKGNEVLALVAGGKAKRPFIADLLEREGVSLSWSGVSHGELMYRMEGALSYVDLVFVCGSLRHHAKVVESLARKGKDAPIPVFLSPINYERRSGHNTI